MRITPVKSVSSWRFIWVRLRLWEIVVRMNEIHGNPDVWFTESPSPRDGSPWALTQEYADSWGVAELSNVIHAVKPEAEFRVESIQDFFAGLRSVTRSRQVYSLYVLARSTIEACAFAVWVYDPDVEPEVRVLRGLLLRAEHLNYEMWTLNQALRKGRTDEGYEDDLAEVTKLKAKVDRAVQQAHTDLQSRTRQASTAVPSVPSPTRRVQEMLHDDMGLPQGFDAYHRLSGVVHSRAVAISNTWNLSKAKPFIDYFDFLLYLHLAVCSIDFCLERRSACWGERHKAPRLRTLIRRLEHMISVEVEPEERLLPL